MVAAMSAAAGMVEIVDRDEELSRIDAVLDGAAEGEVGLIFEGEAGIGKTELWRLAVNAARARGYRVLTGRPAEAESDLAFAGLGDLLADVRGEIAALPAATRRPLSVALLFEEASAAPLDPRAIAVAVLTALRKLGREQPLVVAIDDVQWLDRASSAALAFALRRADAERLGVLLAQRSGLPSALELDPIFPRDRVEVGPLSFGAMQRVVRRRLGAEFSRSTLRRIHTAPAGSAAVAAVGAAVLGAWLGFHVPHTPAMGSGHGDPRREPRAHRSRHRQPAEGCCARSGLVARRSGRTSRIGDDSEAIEKARASGPPRALRLLHRVTNSIVMRRPCAASGTRTTFAWREELHGLSARRRSWLGPLGAT